MLCPYHNNKKKMDLILRLILRFHHILLISNCCSNGVKENVQAFDPASQPGTSEDETVQENSENSENERFYDAQS